MKKTLKMWKRYFMSKTTIYIKKMEDPGNGLPGRGEKDGICLKDKDGTEAVRHY